MKRVESVLARCFLFLLSIVVTFVVLELMTNGYLWVLADEKSFARYASLNQLFEREKKTESKYSALKRETERTNKYSPHRYLGYQGAANYTKGKNRHNRLGYRGEEIAMPKPQGRFRIVCLGGSTTYTTEIDDYKLSYPYLLEKYLKENGVADIDVVNAGVGAWSSWESLINLQFRVLDLDPDLVVVYHSINDIHPRLVWPPDVYCGDNSGRRKPGESSLFMPGIFEYSTFFRMLLIRMGKVTPHIAFERTIDKSPETYYGQQFYKQKKEGVYPKGLFREIPAAQMLESNPPIYFERNIRNMIAIARAHGLEVVISSFAYSTLFTDEPVVASQEYVKAHEENNILLQQTAESSGAHFFDFADKFPTAKQYYADGRHVNEAGAKLKAQFFGDYLIKQHLVTVDQK